MTSTAKKILDAALALPETERQELVEVLRDSLTGDDIELSEAWTSEIASRIAQVESGEVKPVPWNEVKARIEKSLATADVP